MTHADWCVGQMELVLNRVVGTTTGGEGQASMEDLCLNTIKGNNLTQCYIDATVGCQVSVDQQPTDTMKKWEQVMQDIYRLCDGSCPQFLERTINITQCTSMIRFDSLYDNQFNIFCGSLNESLRCADAVTKECPMFSKLFYDLLPQGVDSTANTICTAGCNNFDEAMGVLESCKVHVMNLPEDLDAACSAYNKFKECLRSSSAPVTCPMFEALMEVLYPQHIFGLYEQQCNQTFTPPPGSREECGEMGEARIKHCIRVLALSWPASLNNPPISTKQCQEYKTGLRCLDHAGYHRCPSLRKYFDEATSNRRGFMDLMQGRCERILSGQNRRGRKQQVKAGGTNVSTGLTLLLTAVILSLLACHH
ncbi:hypothetical protein SNE40_003864 [Patella caerulea]|uniref:Uncharacterized protein n=1 Tax=Patella caerulea TaxID=87958 RepID=A0AAN8KCD0_PATCE